MQVDGRRIVQVLVGLVLVTLAVLVVVFTVAGIHNNRQINQLRDQGVAVEVTVTGCQGLLGGSGSNSAGYSCRGSYELDGRRYSEVLPGTSLHVPGSTIRSVAVPGDPALVSPVSIVDSEHASDGVFILPAVLLVILLGALGGLVLLRRGAGERTAG